MSSSARREIVLLCGLAVCLAAVLSASAATLVKDGQPRAVLVVPADADADEKLAAEELRDHVEKISGAKLEIVQAAPADGAAVLIGRAADAKLDDRIRERGKDPASFALVVDDRTISIRGLSSEGTLFGAYELLERLGVRWFMPGELGTVIPRSETIDIADIEVIRVPSFAARWHGGQSRSLPVQQVWDRRVKMGGPYFPSAHGLPILSKHTVETDADLFALYQGKRIRSQHCVSNPRLLAMVVERTEDYFRKHPTSPALGMGPNDGAGFCECENCKALDGGDWDPFSNEPSVTDRYVWFFNQVLKGIEDEFPDKKVAFYVYHSYMRPPVKTKPDPRILPALAPIALCRVHGPNNPVCPESNYYPWLAKEWSKLLPEVYDRGYWFNLADPGIPFPMMHRLRVQIPLAKELGIYGWRVETMNHWAAESPSLYVAAKLMWDHTADVDALTADFTEKFFGPAAKPMHAYLTLLDTTLRDADHHTGSAFDAAHFYPASVRKQARSLLEKARSQAGKKESVYAERVELFAKEWAFLEAFVEMLESRAEHDYATSKQALDRLDAIREEFLKSDPPMFNKWVAKIYLDRFFRGTTEQGHARTSGGNKLVAGLDDQWQFQLDPQRIGEDIGLWRAETTGGNWQQIRTASSSWGNQGLRYYKGEAWYRQTVTIPKEFAGQRVFLWFGGVDEKAKVWVNGKPVGISHASNFIPFEFDATDAIAPGKPNVVVVRVINVVVDELGTGGLMAPAMFYAPAAGKGAKIENAAELGRTFP